MARRNRRKLPYIPVPIDLSKRRRIAPDYANFYGAYITKDGRKKRFSFKVAVDPNKNHEVMRRLIRHTCIKLKNKQIPPVPNGFIFGDFGDLLVATDWMKVRQVKPYRAGMIYER